jgi:hypothetical protein
LDLIIAQTMSASAARRGVRATADHLEVGARSG